MIRAFALAVLKRYSEDERRIGKEEFAKELESGIRSLPPQSIWDEDYIKRKDILMILQELA